LILPEPRDCDLLIRDGLVITMDAVRTARQRGDIAIIGNTIAAVGDTVLVDGRIVLRGGRSTLLDEAAVYATARQRVARPAETAGLQPAAVS